jgi:SAM-dependent methyltransferase
MKDLHSQWKRDEEAPFKGWDFSYLKGRWREEQPRWDYRRKAQILIKNATAVLDMGTGGGEFLASVDKLPEHNVAIEGWLPNVPVARSRLEPLGVRVVATDESGKLPLRDEEFDLVLNRHSAYDEQEVFRVLKKRGRFLTQQVGGDNLKDLLREFSVEPQFGDWTLRMARQRLEEAGFKITEAEEWSGKIEFNDVGALVYFLKNIPWIVKDFSVDRYLPILEKLQRRIQMGERLVFTNARFMILAEKDRLLG